MLVWYDVMSRLPIVGVSVDMTLEYYHQGDTGGGHGFVIGPHINVPLPSSSGASSFASGSTGSCGFSGPSTGGSQYLGASGVQLNDALLDEYIDWKLSWWQGGRPAQGVLPELAYRCS